MTFILVMLHTGTMGAVIAYFWKSWRRSFFSSRTQFASAATRIALATAVSAAVYLALELLLKRTLLRDRPGADLEELFSSLRLISAALAAGGILIFIAGYARRSDTTSSGGGRTESPVSGASAAVIGLAQGLALPFRGLSRSGATISAGMLIGVERRVCEEFSFALAVVITPPAVIRELHRFAKARAAAGGAVDIIALTMPGLFGMVMSFVAGLLALRWLSRWLENGRWHYFGIYCLAAAAAVYALAVKGL